jgi:hypothetical protein
MKTRNRLGQFIMAIGGAGALAVMAAVAVPTPPRAQAGPLKECFQKGCTSCGQVFLGCGEDLPCDEVGGAWYWLRSPEQEKRVVISRFNRYCIRCHGVDGRGVWDIPDVPNFTNARWQACHTDGQLARSILEGRGSVMPPWRGVLSLEEAWAMARYVRTFVPGSEVSRPDFTTPEKPAVLPQAAPAKAPTGS